MGCTDSKSEEDEYGNSYRNRNYNRNYPEEDINEEEQTFKDFEEYGSKSYIFNKIFRW
jgi:hypothetical protein